MKPLLRLFGLSCIIGIPLWVTHYIAVRWMGFGGPNMPANCAWPLIFIWAVGLTGIFCVICMILAALGSYIFTGDPFAWPSSKNSYADGWGSSGDNPPTGGSAITEVTRERVKMWRDLTGKATGGQSPQYVQSGIMPSSPPIDIGRNGQSPAPMETSTVQATQPVGQQPISPVKYVVSTCMSMTNEYCRKNGLDRKSVRHVRDLQGIQGHDITEREIVFYDGWDRIADAEAIRQYVRSVFGFEPTTTWYSLPLQKKVVAVVSPEEALPYHKDPSYDPTKITWLD